MENYRIDTPCGPIQGTGCQWPGVAAFKGIRYATAGRWEYPQPVTRWEGVYDATQYGNCSYQPRAFYDEEQMPEKAFYYNEFRRGEAYTYSEDCLFLNVWTPETAEPDSKLPVLVYIHGGGFTGGCGHEKHFDGPVWPTQGVIGVTINYRLGPMGFVCLPQLAAEAGHTGNYGLFDQVAALQWVRANIAAFGGDPDNVTIMGQSAGAMSVQQLCLSPLTEGLFHKAVMSSGGGVSKLMSPGAPDKNYDFWRAVMLKAGCASLAEFRILPPQQLFEAWTAAKKEQKGALMGGAQQGSHSFGCDSFHARIQRYGCRWVRSQFHTAAARRKSAAAHTGSEPHGSAADRRSLLPHRPDGSRIHHRRREVRWTPFPEWKPRERPGGRQGP